jgi:hypothetical protein
MKADQRYTLHFSPEFTNALGLAQTQEGGEGPKGVERIELLQNNDQADPAEVLAHTEVLLIEEPISCYYSSWLFVHKETAKSFGGMSLLRQFNHFLETRKKPGFLFNAIVNTQAGKVFYTRLGWQEVQGHKNWFSYNLPTDVPTSLVAQTIKKIKKLDPYFKEI